MLNSSLVALGSFLLGLAIAVELYGILMLLERILNELKRRGL